MAEPNVVPPDVAPAAPPWWHTYRTILSIRLRSQLAYPVSFGFDVANQLIYGLLEVIELIVIFHNVEGLGGMGFGEALVVMSLARQAFTMGDLLVGHLDGMPTYLRQGTLDTMLVRPQPVLLQLITADVSLRRVFRVLMFTGIATFALATQDIAWTSGRIILLATAIAGGTLIACALFITASAVQFWLIDAAELSNAFTYGGAYIGQFPSTVLPWGLRVFYTVLLPVTFLGYLPTVTLLGSHGAPWPIWLGWLTLPVGILSIVTSLTLWHMGLRRYQGGGG